MRSSSTRANRAGFTLIELLVTCTVIGVLAAISLPQITRSREKAEVAALRSDLHNLIAAQESYLFETGQYASNAADLVHNSSPGVQVTIDEATAGGWSATASRESGTATCTMWVGVVSAPIGDEGVPVCP